MILKVKDLKPEMVVYSPVIKATFTIASIERSKNYYYLNFLGGMRINASPDCRVSVVGVAK